MITPGPLPTLLLHFDGDNGSTVITDSSENEWAVTAFGNAQLSTADPKFGSAQLLLDGASDYVRTPANAAFAIGTGDFTVDCWCRPDVTVGVNDGLFTFGGLFVCIFNGNWRIGNTGSGGTPMFAATAGQRVHIAVTRQGTSVRFFVDGIQRGATLSWSTNFTGNQLNIGYYSSATFGFDGTIDEFRFINGTAIWTANFTPPTAAYNYTNEVGSPLRPTSRLFAMDEWPQNSVKMRGGRSMTWAQVSSPAGARLELSWDNINSTLAEQIVAKWDQEYGTDGNLILTADDLSGLDPTLAALIQEPFADAKWRFAGPPVIESAKAGRCTVRLTLRTRYDLTADLTLPPAAGVPS